MELRFIGPALTMDPRINADKDNVVQKATPTGNRLGTTSGLAGNADIPRPETGGGVGGAPDLAMSGGWQSLPANRVDNAPVDADKARAGLSEKGNMGSSSGLIGSIQSVAEQGPSGSGRAFGQNN